MRVTALASLSAVLLAGSVISAAAAPSLGTIASPSQTSLIQVAGGCGPGGHRFHRHCVPNRYRPYAWHRRHYAPYPYYGGGYQPLNRPSPGDHVANQLNAQELGR